MHSESEQEQDKASVADATSGGPPDVDSDVARYEEMFASRYTAEDPAYHPYIDKGMDPPPIVEGYFVRRQRPNWNDNRRGSMSNDYRGRKHSYNDERWQGGQYGKRSYHPDRDRDLGHHGGHRGENQWRGHHQPRQDWRTREDQGYGWNQRGGRYDDQGGHSSGNSYQTRHGHSRRENEWT